MTQDDFALVMPLLGELLQRCFVVEAEVFGEPRRKLSEGEGALQ
jgi:hypothetical protein